jgi:hypothetical protein
LSTALDTGAQCEVKLQLLIREKPKDSDYDAQLRAHPLLGLPVERPCTMIKDAVLRYRMMLDYVLI